MEILLFLIPTTLLMGLFIIGFFIWTFKSGQYEDLEGDGQRFIDDED